MTFNTFCLDVAVKQFKCKKNLLFRFFQNYFFDIFCQTDLNIFADSVQTDGAGVADGTLEEGNVDGDDRGDSDGYKDDNDLRITMPLNSISAILIN